MVTPQKNVPAGADFSPESLAGAEFSSEISSLTVIAEDPRRSKVERAEAHRRLAILYLSPRNPQNNLRAAIKELGMFLEMDPGRLNQVTAAGWLQALITAGEEYQLTKEQNLILAGELNLSGERIARLTSEKKDLVEENGELKKIIEKLKRLDLSLEQKRRDLR